MKVLTRPGSQIAGVIYRAGWLALLGICVTVVGCDSRTPHLDTSHPIQSSIYEPPNLSFRLNQIGYYPKAEKLAVVKDTTSDHFELRKAENQLTVFRAELSKPEHWPYANETIRRADFTGFTEPGSYILHIDGLGSSQPFLIANKVHDSVLKATIKSFYYQRASTTLEEDHAGLWQRPLAHPDSQVTVHPSAASASRPAGSVVSAPKGWYDAGDFGKYTPTATYTTWALLHLYETFPGYINSLKISIPETDNTTPDLLDEAKWSLDFLLQMQEPQEGFVYHKLTTASHARKVMPENDVATRYMIGKSTAATLSFAAVTAQASRIYRPFDSEYADTLLAAARRAWQWGLQNPEAGFQNPSDIHTGECKDHNFEDEKNWAAIELYLTTGMQEFLQNAKAIGVDHLKHIPNRRNTMALPYFSLLNHPNALKKISRANDIQHIFFQLADRYKEYALRQSAYRIPLGHRSADFNWGSNGLLASMGSVLAFAWHHTGDKSYREAAVGSLDYILGRNALSLSFVTGFGKSSPVQIHHRPSYADGIADPVPGLMAGGPQAIVKRDKCNYPSALPALRYLDHWCSFTTNEVTINWNAALVHLIGTLEATSD